MTIQRADNYGGNMRRYLVPSPHGAARSTALTTSFVQPLAVDTEGAAALTNISASTLEKMRVRGDGPPYAKVGKIVRYLVDDLHGFMANARVNSTSEARAA